MPALGLANCIVTPRGTRFSPLALANLAAWYDVSQAAGVTTGTGGISSLNDLSGNGRHLTQATSTKRPALTAAGQNGLNVATFDGVDDFMTVAWSRLQPFSFFAALKMRSNPAGSSCLIGFGAYSAPPEAIVYDNSSARTNIRLYFGAGVGNLSLADGLFCSLYGVVNSTSSLISKNGTETSGSAGGNQAIAITLGDSSDEGTVNAAITVGELIVIAAAASADVRAQINSYLRGKWGI